MTTTEMIRGTLTASSEPLRYSAANPPASVEDAEARRQVIIPEMMDIQAALGSRDKQDADGTRLDGKDYWAWRHRAAYALKCRQQEALYLKLWLREQRAAMMSERVAAKALVVETLPDVVDAVGTLEALYGVCVRLIREDVAFTRAERLLVGRAYRTLKAHGITPPNEDAASW